MMLKKSVKILYWIIVCFLASTYLYYKQLRLEPGKSVVADKSDFFQSSDNLLAIDGINEIYSAYLLNPKKMLDNEEESIERIAAIFENSLSNAVNKSIASMSTPRSDLIDTLLKLLEIKTKVLYSTQEIRNIERLCSDIYKNLDYIKRKGVEVNKEYIRELCLEDNFLADAHADIIKYLSQRTNIRSIKEFVLNAILCDDNPHSKLNQILQNKAIKAHNEAQTFVLNNLLDNHRKSFDLSTQHQIRKFMRQPRWNLWAPTRPNNENFIGKVFNLVGLGGSIETLVFETRASNISRANVMIKDYMQKLTRTS